MLFVDNTYVSFPLLFNKTNKISWEVSDVFTEMNVHGAHFEWLILKFLLDKRGMYYLKKMWPTKRIVYNVSKPRYIFQLQIHCFSKYI